MGTVTVATNMAGRGTDIVLGATPTYLAQADLRRSGFNGEVIAGATGYAENNNPDVLEARRQYAESKEKYKEQIARRGAEGEGCRRLVYPGHRAA